MRDAELLTFKSYEDLAARLLPGADDGMPKGKVTLHTVMDEAGATVLLVEPAAKAAIPKSIPVLAARIDEATRLVADRRTPTTPLYRIDSTQVVESLLRAMKPVAAAEPPQELPGGHVLAWCSDGAAFSRLVRECLSLGCDRIRWAGLSAAGAGAVVARIDDPPWYLLERWSRGHDEGAAPVFVTAGQDRFYVRWGFTHPFGGRVRLRENELLLADASGSMFRLPSAEWRDLYDALAISADGLESLQWNPAEPGPRFQVKLHMVEAPEPAEPELWLLSKDDLAAVERLLGLMPESDLKHLAIAFFDGRTALADAPVAALREVITGRGRGWVNFGKKGFRALSGISNLFLPIDRALDPQVRRDRTAAAFGLERGEIVIVEKREPGGMRALRVAESSFRPLTSYVDYVVAGDAARLSALVGATVFDPGPLAQLAEAGVDPARAAKPRDAAAPAVLPAEAADGGEALPDPGPIVLSELSLEEPVEPPLPGGTLATAREHAIEGRIAEDPPGTPADWMALGAIRLARHDRDAAVDCFENARWTDRALDALAVEQSIAALESALDLPKRAKSPGEYPALAHASSDGEGDVRPLRLRALYVEAGRFPETTQTPAYLESLYAEARASIANDRLRKKTRWLVWRAILSKTGDEIEAERQREQILADLNQDGLAPLDRTDFVRPRLAERITGANGDGELVRSLDGLTKRMTRIEDARLRWTGTSLLARRWAELDDVARATQLALESVQACTDLVPGLVARSAPVARILGNAAAALVRVANPKGEEAFRRALEIVNKKTMSNGDDRGRAMQSMLESLASAQNLRISTPLAEAALDNIADDDPRRSALTLRRCAPALLKLEATTRARALALSLASNPQVTHEAHYLAGAVSALATLARPKSLPPAVLAPILEAVRRHQKDLEDVNVPLVEGAVLLAGEEFARQISERMRVTPPGELKFAQITFWACAIEGLASARATDQGLEDLERALRIAWALPNDDERRRCVRRLAACAASFGRVGTGLEIVRDIVRRTEAPGVGPYFRSEVLSACVEGAARLGDRACAFEVMERVIKLVEQTSNTNPGDVTFLFDVLGLCVDHAVTIGAAGDSVAIIRRVEAMVLDSMTESTARYWTPFYRYRALAKCGRGLARLGQEGPGLEILSRILDAANPKPGALGQKITGLDLIDLLREVVRSLSEIGGKQRLDLVDRVLDAFLSERSVILGEAGAELLGLILDEVVSPASRVRAEYGRFLGAEERSIRERVANEPITGAPPAQPPSGGFSPAPRRN